MHLPWSPGLQNDDRLIDSLEAFHGREVVVTEKMDGENASLYSNHYHARSLDSRHHGSRDWIKSFHGTVRHNIPEGWRPEELILKHDKTFRGQLKDILNGDGLPNVTVIDKRN